MSAVSEGKVAADLCWLTEVCEKAGADISGGLLGGQYGYGAYIDNDVFMMHPFCWCERDDCAWCKGCTCPDDITTYMINAKVVTADEFWRADKRKRGAVDDVARMCGFCKGDDRAAPNFLHKASGTEVRWYKYIGRSMDVDVRGDWHSIVGECVAAVGGAQ